MKGVLPALQTFDPDDLQTRIFRAALNSPDQAYAQLEAWEDENPMAVVDYLAGPGKWMRGQLPLVYSNLASPLAEKQLACRPYLKTATVRELKRYQVFLACLTDALAVLAEVGCDYCVVKGVAAAYGAYSKPQLRHCHDLDVIVRAENQKAIAASFAAKGFLPIVMIGEDNGTSLRLDHPTGLPVMLHSMPVDGDARFSADWLLSNTVMIDTEAGAFPIPRRALRIAHTWVQRFGCDRYERQAWVPDTVLEFRACDPEDIRQLNEILQSKPDLTECRASVAYLSKHIEPLPQLDDLRWPRAAQRGPAGTSQRMRFVNRARAQGVMAKFYQRLPPLMRARFTYDWVLPPAAHFGLSQSAGWSILWRKRLRRIGRAAAQRLARRRSPKRPPLAG